MYVFMFIIVFEICEIYEFNELNERSDTCNHSEINQ